MKIIILGNINKLFLSQITKELKKQHALYSDEKLIIKKLSIHKESSFYSNRKKIIEFVPEIIISGSSAFLNFGQMNKLFDYLFEKLKDDLPRLFLYENDDDLLKQLMRLPIAPSVIIDGSKPETIDQIAIKNIYYKLPILKTFQDKKAQIKKQIALIFNGSLETFQSELQDQSTVTKPHYHLKDVSEIALRYYTINAIFHEKDIKLFPALLSQRIEALLAQKNLSRLQSQIKENHQNSLVPNHFLKVFLVSQYQALLHCFSHLLEQDAYRIIKEEDQADLIIDFDNLCAKDEHKTIQLLSVFEAMHPKLKTYDYSEFHTVATSYSLNDESLNDEKKKLKREKKNNNALITQLKSKSRLLELDLNIIKEAQHNKESISKLLDKAYVFKQYYPRKINTDHLLFISFDQEKDKKARVKYKEVKHHLWFNLSYIADLESFTKINFKHFNIFLETGSILIQESCLLRLNRLLEKIQSEIEQSDRSVYDAIQSNIKEHQKDNENKDQHLSELEQKMIHQSICSIYYDHKQAFYDRALECYHSKMQQARALSSIEKIMIIGNHSAIKEQLDAFFKEAKIDRIDYKPIDFQDCIEKNNDQLDQRTLLVQAMKSYIAQIIAYFQANEDKTNAILIDDIDLFIKYFAILKKSIDAQMPVIIFLSGAITEEKINKIQYYPFHYILFEKSNNRLDIINELNEIVTPK